MQGPGSSDNRARRPGPAAIVAPGLLRTVQMRRMVATVADPSSPFLDALLPVGSRKLAAHANAVTCVLAGRTGPLQLECDGRRIDGDILLIRPGVVHAVALAERGADVLYLNGLAFPFDAPLAQVLGGVLAHLASDALRGDRCAMHELRARLTAPAPRLPTGIAEVMRAIYADPMQRMSQDELGAPSAYGANAGSAVFQGRDGADVPGAQEMVCAATRGAADDGGRSGPHRGHGRRLRGHGAPVARLSPRLRIDAQRGDRRTRTMICLGDREHRGEDLEEHSRTAITQTI